MINKFKSLKFNFLIAFLIRLIFTLYGLYHDSKALNYTQLEEFDELINNQNENENETKTNQIPKYTDVDYQVFTDAAYYVYQGESPYLRDTYRYTPILAYLMLPNIFLNESFGKFLFILFDLICGCLIIKINEIQFKNEFNNLNDKKILNEKNLFSILFWFYNPITIAIASRGNAESLMSFLVLCFLLCLKLNRFILAGLFYGLAIHFKIYPITYALALLFYFINFKYLLLNFKQLTYSQLIISILLNKNLLKFVFSSLIILIGLTIIFYIKYGYIFLFETYLYHLSRSDIRHNFSPYFYMLYLSDLTLGNSIWIKLFSFLPQLILIFTFSYYLYNQIEFCLFLITFTFVTFNKVCTSQYFVWYLSLIPVIIPRLKLNISKSIAYFALWMFGQAVWLYFAFELEFNGNNTFLSLFLAGILFACINCFILKHLFLNSFHFNQNFLMTQPKID